MLEITATRLNYWEKDKREPDVLMIKKISQLLGVSSDWLIGNDDFASDVFTLSAAEQNKIKKYRSLDRYGREAVDSVLDIEYKRCSEPENGNNIIDISAPNNITASIARSNNDTRKLEIGVEIDDNDLITVPEGKPESGQ